MTQTSVLTLISLALAAASSCAPKEAPPAAAGAFEATDTIVSSEGSGRLVTLLVEEGQEVAAGDVVGQLDCKQLELQRDFLAAQIGGLRTRVTDVGTQTAPLKQQIDSAEREQKRIEKLAATGAMTQKQLDDANAQVAVLHSQEEATTQSLKTGNNTLSDQRTAMEIQRAQLDDQIARCTIKSPIEGTVLAKYAEQGEFTAPGKPLFKVADMKHLFLRAYVTADQVTQMKLGQTVSVRADFGADGTRSYDGTIIWISDKSEFTPKTILTRDERADLVYAVKIAVTNDGFLKLGMYGFVPSLSATEVAHAGDQRAEHR
ncbi:MAG TPA: HlyD family efflux transporter periplasmic adaptor subunit [Polyangiaceae bacterium]|jgi:HlyD family secretion protein